MKKCPYCAEEIQNEAIFCRYCRHDLSVPTTLQKIKAEPHELNKKPRHVNPWWAIVFLIILGVTVIIIFNLGMKETQNAVIPTEEATKKKPTNTPAIVLYSTDFSSNDGEWLEITDKDSDFDVVNGKYKIKSEKKDYVFWSYPSHSFTDGIMKVKLLVDSSDLSDGDGYYILWRNNDEKNHYGLGILRNGEVFVRKLENDKEIIQFQSDPGLVSFFKGDITIVISFVGSKFNIFINDQLITSFSDTSFADGEIGLGVITDDSQGAIVAYDNVIVYSPDAANNVLPKSRITPTLKSGNASCTQWSDISLSDVGKTMCVYGNVINSYYQESFGAYIFLYSSDPNALYLIKHKDVYWEGVIGRCVRVTGKIQKYYQTPYIEIKEDFVYMCD